MSSNEKLWWYAKGEERIGPLTAVEFKKIAATGALALTDLIWKEGLANWIPASSIKGLVPAAAPLSPPPLPSKSGEAPLGKTAAAIKENQTREKVADKAPILGHPALWNPLALANWSVLLTPLFGAYFVTENYKAMARQQDAKKSMDWFYIGIAIMLSLFLLVMIFSGAGFGLTMLMYITYLISWYFLSARKQQKLILSECGKDYERQPWGKILAIGVAANIVWQIVLAMLF